MSYCISIYIKLGMVYTAFVRISRSKDSKDSLDWEYVPFSGVKSMRIISDSTGLVEDLRFKVGSKETSVLWEGAVTLMADDGTYSSINVISGEALTVLPEIVGLIEPLRGHQYNNQGAADCDD